jgi:ABC-2 type transport system permease protein
MPVFDQGYQHWSGTLSGHAWRWFAITRHGVRVALGNRCCGSRLSVAWLPALLLATAVCFWGLVEQQSELIQSLLPLLGFLDRAMLLDPRAYRVDSGRSPTGYFMLTQLRIAMVLILLVGPNLISQDLRYNARSPSTSRDPCGASTTSSASGASSLSSSRGDDRPVDRRLRARRSLQS